MKRCIAYIAILALVVAAPAKPVDIGELIPIRAMGVWQAGKQIQVETDAGNTGIGETVEYAIRDMKETASGVIYLDKVEYLILTEQTLDAAEALRGELNGRVGLCVVQQPVDLGEVSHYLDVHGTLPKLKTWSKGVKLPSISSYKKTQTFSKKSEKRY